MGQLADGEGFNVVVLEQMTACKRTLNLAQLRKLYTHY